MLFRMRLLPYVLKSGYVIFKYKKMFQTKPDFSIRDISWCPGVVVITTAQFSSTKPELRFCADSDPAGGVSDFPTMSISGNGLGWKYC